MKTIFTFKTNSRVRPFDLLVKNRNTEKFGSKSFMALGPKIWNVLPKKIKQETSFSKFKEYPNNFYIFMMEALIIRDQPIDFHDRSIGWVHVGWGTPS